MRKRKDPLIRFEKKFYKTVDGCWNWQGATQSIGYGMMGMFDEQDPDKPMVMQLSHRLAYQFYIGEIPEGMDVLHHCDNRRCVNPSHLFLGDAKANVDDMIAKDRHRHRALKGESHPKHILTWDQVKEIRASATDSVTNLSKKYGVSVKTIYKVLENEIWKDPNYVCTRARQTRENYAKGLKHPLAKLNIEQIREIRTSKLSAYDLAKKFGVCRQTVYETRTYKRYKEEV